MNVAPRGLSFTDAQRGGETSRARKDGRAEQEAGGSSGLRYPGPA